jgi:hypothetical protein
MAPAIFALAALVPSLLRFLGKDNEAAVADKVVEVGKALTGKEEPAAIAEALKANPELLAQFQRMATEVVIAEMNEETKRLAETNATMRAEIASNDPFVRRARPAFLYAMALTWTLQMIGLMVAIALNPQQGAALITAAAGLTAMWSVALAVVGVYVKGRSDEKKVAAGKDAPSMLESIADMVGRK